MKKEIDLKKYCKDNDFLSGRPEGKDARKNEALDNFNLLEKDNVLEIIIPESIIGINVSFFLGLLSLSLKPFNTKEEILNKVKFNFKTNDPEKIELIGEDINYMIKKVLDKRDIDDVLC